MIIIIHLTIISIISTVWAQADQDYCKFSPKHTMCQYKVEFDTITINIIIDIPPCNILGKNLFKMTIMLIKMPLHHHCPLTLIFTFLL